MTTIAYRGRVLAGDTLEIQGDTKLPGVSRKVFKLRDGSLFGAAGTSQDIALVLQSLKTGKFPDKEDLDVLALHIRSDGSVWRTEGKTWEKISVPYAAIGSGQDFALCAMKLGHDAKTAVRMGIEFDRNSGGRVQAVKLKDAQ